MIMISASVTLTKQKGNIGGGISISITIFIGMSIISTVRHISAYTRNVRFFNVQKAVRAYVMQSSMKFKISHRLFSAIVALVLPIPSFLEDRLFSTDRSRLELPRRRCRRCVYITKISRWPRHNFSICKRQAVVDDKQIICSRCSCCPKQAAGIADNINPIFRRKQTNGK